MEFGKLKLVLAGVGFVGTFGVIYGGSLLLGEGRPLIALAVSGVSVAAAWMVLHSLARRAAMIPFKSKGKVLQRAKVRLDLAEPLPAPAWMADLPPDADDEDDLPPRYYYRLEITVAPAAPKGVFQYWDPYDLSCVAKGFKATWKTIGEDEEPGFDLEELEIWDGQGFSKESVDKVPGRQRLRFSVGVPDGVLHLQMLYYFEVFGNLRLPPHPLMKSG